MRNGPDIARIAALVGDPARAAMLTALMDSQALTASELAIEAGVTPQTASTHLARLAEAGLLRPTQQGRHRYFSIGGREVAAMLEAIMGVAEKRGPSRTRPGPRDQSMRHARACYDHLAGRKAVILMDALRAAGEITEQDGALQLSPKGARRFASLGIDFAAIEAERRPMCRSCLDWSVRRPHLAGALGAAFFARIVELGWARREADSRVVRFSPAGEAAFERFVALT
jgi:DNA-binding transcriptional ArsR family regulator